MFVSLVFFAFLLRLQFYLICSKERENSGDLCVLPPLLGERAGVRASVSSQSHFRSKRLAPFWIFDFGFEVRASLPRLLRGEKSFASITTPLLPVGVTARSGPPSPLKSPTAKAHPTWPYLTAAWKVPSPLPKSTETTSPESPSAKSSLPSPFKSATAKPNSILCRKEHRDM